MIKQNTAQNLGKYLGHQVHLAFIGDIYTDSGILNTICLDHNEVKIDSITRSLEKWCVYPILKTYDKLTNMIIFKNQEIIAAKHFYKIQAELKIMERESGNCLFGKELWGKYDVISFYIFPDFEINSKLANGQVNRPPLSYLVADELISFGFGAIPDTESPTGYVDLFGYPCVTP